MAGLLFAAPAAHAAVFTVTGTGDGTGFCDRTNNCPTLRAAVTAANAGTDSDTINVPAGVINLTDDLVINSPVAIVGASARTTVIDGGGKYRAFRISGEGTLGLTRFTIRNGAAGGGGFTDGGGIYNAGSLGLIDVRVTGSRAVRGGGIANDRGLIQADNLLVDNNVATGAGGGGIHNIGGQEVGSQDGWLVLEDMTLFANTATAPGGVGGLASTGTGALISLTRSTVADNVGGTLGAGGLSPSGVSGAVGTIVARNLVGGTTVNCAIKLGTDGGFNVEDDTDCSLAPGGLKPGLATALSSEGGQLDVLAITTDSPAFNLLPGFNSACAGSDQRGLARPKGGSCEAGAYELNAGASVRITAGPPETITTTSTEFQFQDSGGDVTLQCDLTGPGQTAGFEPCYKSNVQPYNGLADGPYTFSVRAVSSEFPNPPVTTRTFTVNTGPPETTITSGPSGTTNDSTPTFTFTSSEPGSTFQCRVGTAAFTACTSPHTTAVLADGPRTFEVRAVDAAGVVDPTPAMRTITVDTTPPDTTIASGPSGFTASTTAAFTWTSTEAGSTFQCSLDNGPFGPCPVNYTGLSQGAHTFRVRATDAVGNTDPTPASRTWTVDTVAPLAPSITSAPNSPGNDNTPTFTFTGEAGATYQCRLGTAPFVNCTSPHTTAALADGSYTFAVRAVDQAGNEGTPTTFNFTVDTIAPAAPVVTQPAANAWVPTSTVTVAGTAEATASVVIMEGAITRGTVTASAGGTWSVNVVPVTDGSHTYTVTARDRAGNTSVATTRTFSVDTSLPETTITGGPSGLTNNARPQWTFTSNEPSPAFECSLDGAAYATCQSPFSPATNLSQGPHTFTVRAVDRAGNRDSTPETRTITVDTVAPNPPTITEAIVNGSTVTLRGTAEADATIELYDGPAPLGTLPADASGTWQRVLTDVADGMHSYSARARDAAGNRSEASEVRQVLVDTGPPEPPSVVGPGALTNNPRPTFTFTGETTRFDCSLDGGRFAPCASPFVTPALPDGEHRLAVIVYDVADNRSEPRTVTFVVDTTPPAGAVTAGPAGVTADPNPAFAFTASERKTECRLDGPGGPGNYAPCVSPKAFSALAPGAYVFFVRVTDPAGNRTETRREFTVVQPQPAQATPEPPVRPAQAPVPTPVPNQTVVVLPVTGTVLVKPKGQRKFVPLDATQGIPNGSEVDVRKGRVTLTSTPRPGAAPESADFYGGMFVVTQKGGITDLRLSERLTGCPKGQQARVSLAKKKVKKRKLWGAGKGAFRTTGKHSAATVRGTVWLVEDTCTTTLTRVTQGVVQVNDFVKKRRTLVKKGKRYVARAKKR